MITTRDIKVDLSLGKRPLQQKTTKEIDVRVKVGKPQPTKIVVSTNTIEDVADIAEKARRDKIAKQKAKVAAKKKADKERMEKARAAKEEKAKEETAKIQAEKEKKK